MTQPSRYSGHQTDIRPKIIYEACGLPGHPANKCFRRGFHFLPRDIKRRLSACNKKYRDNPTNDCSDQTSHRQVLPAPETKIPQEHKLPTNQSGNTTNQATIQKLQHVLALPTNTNDTTPHEEIEFINENTPIIRTMSQQTPKILQPQYTHAPESYTNPLSIDILSENGEKNLIELHTLQDQLL